MQISKPSSWGLRETLVLESFISSFYVAVTRGLTPIFLVAVGFDLKSILLLNITAYILALATSYVLWSFKSRLSGCLKRNLILFHALEKIAWCSIPLSAALSRTLLYIDYMIAVALTIPTTTLIYALIYGCFDDSGLRYTVSRRAAFGASSNILGQLTVILVLASSTSPVKYLKLYTTALVVGLSATALLASSGFKNPSFIRSGGYESSEASVRIVDVFVFLSLLLSSGSLLGVAWAPYLMTRLKAPDYIAACLGLIQNASSMISSLYWSGKSLNTYRVAITVSAVTPALVMLANSPEANLALASLYAFSYTGSNFLASIIYGESSRSLGDPVRASISLASAASLSQVIGSLLALSLSSLYHGIFIASSILSLLALAVAFTSIPEVSVVPSYTARVYARVLYNVSVSSYNFTLFTLRSSFKLAINLLGITCVFILLYILYKMVYYITILTGGVVH